MIQCRSQFASSNSFTKESEDLRCRFKMKISENHPFTPKVDTQIGKKKQAQLGGSGILARLSRSFFFFFFYSAVLSSHDSFA